MIADFARPEYMDADRASVGEYERELNTLHPLYEVKSLADGSGFWVDGCYGYAVTGMYPTAEEAAAEALKAIRIELQADARERPSWVF